MSKAKEMQIKMIVDDTEDELSDNDDKDLIDADLEKTKKAMAYEKIREIVQD